MTSAKYLSIFDEKYETFLFICTFCYMLFAGCIAYYKNLYIIKKFKNKCIHIYVHIIILNIYFFLVIHVVL